MAISSSAAVESLFVVGSDILRSKRSSVTKENFEKFVLLRENIKCLKKSIFLHELDGSLPANPVNDRRTANAVTLKSTFCLS